LKYNPIQNQNQASHPVRVRGLKLALGRQVVEQVLSHPVRVRGLKRE